MIQNIESIKGREFIFPILLAADAVYKVSSVVVTDIQKNSKKGWGAVILAEFTYNEPYSVPEHVVFTIEYDTDIFPTYKLTCVTSDSYQAKIDVSKGAVRTPEGFFQCLRELAESINNAV